jgi:hypothetical protein
MPLKKIPGVGRLSKFARDLTSFVNFPSARSEIHLQIIGQQQLGKQDIHQLLAPSWAWPLSVQTRAVVLMKL